MLTELNVPVMVQNCRTQNSEFTITDHEMKGCQDVGADSRQFEVKVLSLISHVAGAPLSTLQSAGESGGQTYRTYIKEQSKQTINTEKRELSQSISRLLKEREVASNEIINGKERMKICGILICSRQSLSVIYVL